jgi:hypothetical protein
VEDTGGLLRLRVDRLLRSGCDELSFPQRFLDEYRNSIQRHTTYAASQIVAPPEAG